MNLVLALVLLRRVLCAPRSGVVRFERRADDRICSVGQPDVRCAYAPTLAVGNVPTLVIDQLQEAPAP